jgi:uncharacterized protein
MSEVQAHPSTEHGAKYVQQLCKHWSHRFPVEMVGNRSVIKFEGATATLEPDEKGIRVTLSGEDRDQLERMKDVVAQHIDRFAFREAPLKYDWAWM